jgi:hypothetical protein
VTVVLADAVVGSTWNAYSQPTQFHVKRVGGKDPE